MARIVISINFGSSQPRFPAPFVMTSLEHPAANFLSLKTKSERFIVKPQIKWTVKKVRFLEGMFP